MRFPDFEENVIGIPFSTCPSVQRVCAAANVACPHRSTSAAGVNLPHTMGHLSSKSSSALFERAKLMLRSRVIPSLRHVSSGPGRSAGPEVNVCHNAAHTSGFQTSESPRLVSGGTQSLTGSFPPQSAAGPCPKALLLLAAQRQPL
eukprot:m.161721 g.161721  ORF g.161721 m.161721 type:complete len:146 (-) comp14587_c0_seq6:199-636(-)